MEQLQQENSLLSMENEKLREFLNLRDNNIVATIEQLVKL